MVLIDSLPDFPDLKKKYLLSETAQARLPLFAVLAGLSSKSHQTLPSSEYSMAFSTQNSNHHMPPKSTLSGRSQQHLMT